MQKVKWTRKKKMSDGLSLPNQRTIIINIIYSYFFKILKNYNEIQ